MLGLKSTRAAWHRGIYQLKSCTGSVCRVGPEHCDRYCREPLPCLRRYCNRLSKCWGSNSKGQMGLGGLTPSTVLAPIDVPDLSTGVTAVAVGHGHSCAVVNGGVKCWGHGELGQLGITPAVNSYSPVVVPGLESGVTGVSSGFYHNCASTSSGVKCWGYNNTGSLGNGLSSEITPLVATQGLSGRVSSLDMGMYHSCAIDDDVAKCWGSGASGAIGNNSTTNALMPAEVQPGL